MFFWLIYPHGWWITRKLKTQKITLVEEALSTMPLKPLCVQFLCDHVFWRQALISIKLIQSEWKLAQSSLQYHHWRNRIPKFSNSGSNCTHAESDEFQRQKVITAQRQEGYFSLKKTAISPNMPLKTFTNDSLGEQWGTGAKEHIFQRKQYVLLHSKQHGFSVYFSLVAGTLNFI